MREFGLWESAESFTLICALSDEFCLVSFSNSCSYCCESQRLRNFGRRWWCCGFRNSCDMFHFSSNSLLHFKFEVWADELWVGQNTAELLLLIKIQLKWTKSQRLKCNKKKKILCTFQNEVRHCVQLHVSGSWSSVFSLSVHGQWPTWTFEYESL